MTPAQPKTGADSKGWLPFRPRRLRTATEGSLGLLPPVLACATLGLAPFVPTPHVWEKLRWVASGAAGMDVVAWFDLAMHAAPFGWLVVAVVRRVRARPAEGGA